MARRVKDFNKEVRRDEARLREIESDPALKQTAKITRKWLRIAKMRQKQLREAAALLRMVVGSASYIFAFERTEEMIFKFLAGLKSAPCGREQRASGRGDGSP